MSTMPAAGDTPDLRRASRAQLSLALIDARNFTLQVLARLEHALGPELRLEPAPHLLPPLWIAGHVAWLAEYWIARNPQRGLGPRCPPGGLRIASVEPEADGWFALGVQWRPASGTASGLDIQLFRGLIDAATKLHGRRGRSVLAAAA